MVESFLSLNYGESGHTVARSRFLGFAFFIDSEEDATEKLSALKSRFSDATHICYAYVADTEGNTVRFSDAGEPGGTAGAPILEVIKSRRLNKVLIAVVRYFGGTKLGTGGLCRAYFNCAALAADAAQKINYVFCDIVRVNCDFISCSKLQTNTGFKILSAEYSSFVTLEVAFPKKFDYKAYLDALTNGKATTEFLSSKYIEI